MSGIGNTKQLQSLSNCFVIEEPYDSYGGILKTDQEQVQIMKRRGGVGFDISTIRPRGLKTANAARTTDGIEVFMERWSNSCREVAQGGRRGALMLTISCHHPQILDFIRIKRDLKKVTGANISVRVTDEFMNAVENDKTVQLRFPVEKDVEHLVEKDVSAKEIWDELIKGAHDYAEPGILFWDTFISQSPADIYASDGFKTVSTNPCAELGLPSGDSCRLIIVNLASFVVNAFLHDASFSYELFHDIVIKAQRLMDDLVDLEVECVDKIIEKISSDPEPLSIRKIELDLWLNIRKKAIAGRRTGLGITGLGDMVAMLNMRYGSKEAIEQVGNVYRALAVATYTSSAIMAGERGTFPLYDQKREAGHPFIERLLDSSDELRSLVTKYGRRNIACNTTAPAGTVSLMTQTTSGIEPVFLLSYKRRAKISNSDVDARVDYIDALGDKWQEFDVIHPKLKTWMDVTGESDILKSPYANSTSADIDWESKIHMQAAAQKWIDHSLSNTVNLPENTPIDVTKRIYMLGWKLGCKGVTVYRAGSRSGVLIDSKKTNATFVDHQAPKRPKELPCKIHHANVKGELWTILVGLLNDRPYEVFGGLSKYVEIPKKYDEGILIKSDKKATNATYDLKIGNGSGFVIKNVVDQFDNPNHSVMTRMISLSLRHGASVQYIAEQLQKGEKDADMSSFSRVISRVLKMYIKDGTASTGVKKCEVCSGTDIVYAEGCATCLSCSWSKCG